MASGREMFMLDVLIRLLCELLIVMAVIGKKCHNSSLASGTGLSIVRSRELFRTSFHSLEPTSIPRPDLIPQGASVPAFLPSLTHCVGSHIQRIEQPSNPFSYSTPNPILLLGGSLGGVRSLRIVSKTSLSCLSCSSTLSRSSLCEASNSRKRVKTRMM